MITTTTKTYSNISLMLSSNPLSRPSATLLRRSIHSRNASFQNPASHDQASDSASQKEKSQGYQLNQTSSSSPGSTGFSPPRNENSPSHLLPKTGGHHAARQGYPHLPNNQQRNPNLHPLPQFATSQTPNQGQSPFPSRNSYNQSFLKPSQYPSPQASQRAWDYRTPPHFYQVPHQPVPGFVTQRPVSSPQPHEGFRDANRPPAQRFQPQGYPSPFPPHMSHTSHAPATSAQPSMGYGMFPHPPFMPQPSMNSSTPFNASPQPPIQRSKKTLPSDGALDFDFQDLDGANALDQFAQANNILSNPLTSNPPTYPQHSVNPTAGNRSAGSNFARGPPYSQPWNYDNSSGAANYPRSAPRPNFNARNSQGNKSHTGVRMQPRNHGDSRRTAGPNQFRRDRGRGLLTPKPEPELPPPPKTVLNEHGEYGMKPTPSGVPANIMDSQSSKSSIANDSLSDYRSIPRLITESTTPIHLPGFTKPIPLETSKLGQAHESDEITWTHGDANKDDIVNRAHKLVIQNPSLDIIQKKQTVALVDFLLLSKEERMSRMKS